MTFWPKRLPHPALVFVVIAWGLNFTIIKVAYRSFDPAAVGLLRYAFMLPVLAVWCLLAKQSLAYPKGRFWSWNFAGFVGSGVYMVLFLEGMRTAPAALGAIALSTAPIIATFLSVMVGQDKFTWRLLAGSLVAFGGVAVCILGSESKSSGSVHGALLVLGSAALWAVSVIMYRRLLDETTPVRVLTLSFPGAMLVIVPYGWHAVATTDFGRVSAEGWLALVYLVLVAGVGAFAAYYKGLADVGPARTSLTAYFVPPVAAIFSAIVLHDRIGANEIVGLGIVIAGVALAVWKTSMPTVPEECGEAAGQ